MARQRVQIAPTVHVYEETFATATTLTYQSYFKETLAIIVTGKKATATALLFTWSRSGNTITITASGSSSEVISIMEIGR